MPDEIDQANDNLERAGIDAEVKEIVADKGYHKTAVVTECAARGVRTYIPERRNAKGKKRRWKNRPPEDKHAHYANRRRVRGNRGRALQRKRSERVERSFAHVCETGGSRRAWLCGLEPNRKRYTIAAAAHNLGRIMRSVFGIGKPRCLQGHLGAFLCSIVVVMSWIWACTSHDRTDKAHNGKIPANSCT